MNIIVLNSSPNNYATRSIVKAGRKRGHKMHVLDPVYFSPLISNIESGYDRMYDMIAGVDKRLIIKNIDAVITRMANNIRYNSIILDHLVNNMRIFSTQSPEGIRIAANKFQTLQVCSRYGIRVPKTVYTGTLNDVEFLIRGVGKLPLVVKNNYGSQGTGVMILETKKSALSTIQSLIKNKTDFIIQEFIDSGGTDIRVIVIGSKVVASYQRKAARGEFRSNLSIGGEGIPVPITEEEEVMCIKASNALGLSVCGIDIMRGKNGISYLNEVNANFGFKVQKITNVNVADKIIAFVESGKVNRGLQTDNVDNVTLSVYKARNTKLNRITKSLMENPAIQDNYEKAFNKTISYRDTKGKKQRVKVKNPMDIYRIIFDTFKIN